MKDPTINILLKVVPSISNTYRIILAFTKGYTRRDILLDPIYHGISLTGQSLKNRITVITNAFNQKE